MKSTRINKVSSTSPLIIKEQALAALISRLKTSRRLFSKNPKDMDSVEGMITFNFYNGWNFDGEASMGITTKEKLDAYIERFELFMKCYRVTIAEKRRLSAYDHNKEFEHIIRILHADKRIPREEIKKILQDHAHKIKKRRAKKQPKQDQMRITSGGKNNRHQNSHDISSSIVTATAIWIGEPERLSLLFTALNNTWINKTTFEKFSPHFLGGNGIIEKIKWEGEETQIIYFFDLLYGMKLLVKKFFHERFAWIEKHLLNKYGGSFDNVQLAKSAQNILKNKTKKPRGAVEIEKLFGV